MEKHSENFIEQELLPHILLSDGNNCNNIIIMDNASVHHGEKVTDLIASVGALLIFTPRRA